MKIVILSSSSIGTKTRIVAKELQEITQHSDPNAEISFLDLSTYQLPFSDGRLYLDYKGDALHVTTSLMEAQIIFIVHPIFQASIPAALKNVLELLPMDGLKDKIIGIVSVAGIDMHYLVAQHSLKPVLEYMKGEVIHPYVFVKDTYIQEGKIIDETIEERLTTLVDIALTKRRVQDIINEEKEAEFGF